MAWQQEVALRTGGGGVTRGGATIDNQPENKRGVAKGSGGMKGRGGLVARGNLATRGSLAARGGEATRQ